MGVRSVVEPGRLGSGGGFGPPEPRVSLPLIADAPTPALSQWIRRAARWRPPHGDHRALQLAADGCHGVRFSLEPLCSPVRECAEQRCRFVNSVGAAVQRRRPLDSVPSRPPMRQPSSLSSRCSPGRWAAAAAERTTRGPGQSVVRLRCYPGLRQELPARS
ncbi:DUF6207 family protein [Streptomyces eurythermus]|uniref:DUF6207 family protein n=1 Tax=Streptomyces eurythermus TaxID=42237 RepID=UPI0033DDADAF